MIEVSAFAAVIFTAAWSVGVQSADSCFRFPCGSSKYYYYANCFVSLELSSRILKYRGTTSTVFLPSLHQRNSWQNNDDYAYTVMMIVHGCHVGARSATT